MTEIRNDDSIFVSIASYRDIKCPLTVKSLYENARHPERVFVGIVQQNDETRDPDCYHTAQISPHLKSNIRIMRLSHSAAQGPTWARFLATTLWEGENYFLMLDSHMIAIPDWDVKLINQYKTIIDKGLSKKPIISTYPKDWSEVLTKGVENDDNNVTRTCKAFMHNDDEIVSFEGAALVPKPDEGKFSRHFALAGGLLFAHASFIKEVPFDPKLNDLFVGEEILMSAKAYTKGWDVFDIADNYFYHYYERPNEPKYWAESKVKFFDGPAKDKLKAILRTHKTNIPKHLEVDLEIYGLGTERSIEEFWDYIGVDWKSKTVNKDFCQNELEGFALESNPVGLIVVIMIAAFIFVLWRASKLRKF